MNNINTEIKPFTTNWPKKLDPALQPTYKKILKIFWDVISVVIFPIGLFRLGLYWLRNLGLRLIIPGKYTPTPTTWEKAKALALLALNPNQFRQNDPKQIEKFLNQHNGKQIFLNSPDGAKLDGAIFPGKNRKKAILYLGGREHQWENDCARMKGFFDLETTVMKINARGIGRSSGYRYEEGYALDVYTAYKYLIEVEKLDPEDILTVGFSMGGAYGTWGASLIQEEYPEKKISVINLCSFSNLRKEINELLKRGSLFKRVGSILAYFVGLNMPIKERFDILKGKKVVFYRKEDDVILKPASLYKAVKLKPQGVSYISRLQPGLHKDPYTEQDWKRIHQEVRNILKLSGASSSQSPHLKVHKKTA